MPANTQKGQPQDDSGPLKKVSRNGQDISGNNC